MYPNNINIVFYLLVMAVGLFVGNFISWCNFCYLHDRKVFSKEFFKKDLFEVKYTYILMIVIAFLYVGVLYRFGWEKDSNFVFLIFKNLDLFRFYILIPILVLCFLIDLKKRIIPNRLTLTIFEVGLFFTFIYGLNNINVAKDMLLGCLVGGIVFGLITLLGKLIAGKETMGMGDVKLIATLGLFFGVSNILQISLLSFVIAAIVSIVVLIIRTIKKKDDKYISFGPFIVISTIICILAPQNIILNTFLGICTLASKIVLKK